MSELYSIGFRGEVADGHTLEDVRLKFGTRFRKNDDALNRIFSGDAITLARELDWDKANAVAGRLKAFGAVVYLVDGDGHPVDMPGPANDPSAAADETGDSHVVLATPDASIPVRESGIHDLTATAKVRHLTQITEKRVVKKPSAKVIRKTRWRYRFDTFMAKGGGSIFKALTAVFIATFLPRDKGDTRSSRPMSQRDARVAACRQRCSHTRNHSSAKTATTTAPTSTSRSFQSQFILSQHPQHHTPPTILRKEHHRYGFL